MSIPDQYRYYQVGSDWYRTWGEDVVQFWNGHRWVRSVLPDRQSFLDDARSDGDEVCEISDLSEVPGVHS